MRVLDWEGFVGSFRAEAPMAATVGVFDGLHVGHRVLVAEVLAARAEARARGGDMAAVAFTFRENPKKLLRPASYHGDLASPAQKLEAFEALGLDLVVLIDFSGNFSKLAGIEFLTLLSETGRASLLAIGPDFRCGHRLDTDAAAIAAFGSRRGLSVRILDPVLAEGEPVSSSRIRKAVSSGKLRLAATLLGRDFELDLRGAELPAEASLGDARAFAVPEGRIAPPEGRYAVGGAASIGRAEGVARIEAGKVFVTPGGAALDGLLPLAELAKETKR